MLSPITEKKFLQAAIAIGCLVPIFGGLSGMINGASILDKGGYINLDSHFRYLSGLLVGIGFSFLLSIPRIENRSARMRLLTLIVFVGGMGRLAGFLSAGLPDVPMQAALVMELIVTPLICLWQHRIAKRLGVSPTVH